MDKLNEKTWKEYRDKEVESLRAILATKGYALDKHQPHILGERFLMQAMTTAGGIKLILVGERKEDGFKVLIKATKDKNGARELSEDRNNKAILRTIDFAASVLLMPEEIEFGIFGGYTISVQEFIDQPCTFLEREQKEQFFLSLNAFKAQEGTHAATNKHLRIVKRAFGIYTSDDYLKNIESFLNICKQTEQVSDGTLKLIEQSKQKLLSKQHIVDQYARFLVHTDFVPHNFRVNNQGDMYLLDHSSFRFGNKYEGWARFLNFMTLYNHQLEKDLTEYVQNNRTKEEQESLHLMRLYRLCEINSYYAKLLSSSENNLFELNAIRVDFWSEVLKAQLDYRFVDRQIVAQYENKRDALRSEEEKVRQIGLH